MPDTKTILLVEDNPDDELLTLRALQKGHVRNRVIVARDGAEALDLLLKNPLPELVLLDLKLPKVDGLEVLGRIRADSRTSLLPVVILTSSREDRDLTEAYKRGANSYICKPVDIAVFTEAVQKLEVYWLLLNESVKAGGPRSSVK